MRLMVLMKSCRACRSAIPNAIWIVRTKGDATWNDSACYNLLR